MFMHNGGNVPSLNHHEQQQQQQFLYHQQQLAHMQQQLQHLQLLQAAAAIANGAGPHHHPHHHHHPSFPGTVPAPFLYPASPASSPVTAGATHSNLAVLAAQRGIPPPPPHVLAETVKWSHQLHHHLLQQQQQQQQQQRSPHQSPSPVPTRFTPARSGASPGNNNSHGSNNTTSHNNNNNNTSINADNNHNCNGSGASARNNADTSPHHLLSCSTAERRSSGGGDGAVAAAGAAAASSTSAPASPNAAGPLPSKRHPQRIFSPLEQQLLAVPHIRLVELLSEICSLHRDARGYAEAKLAVFQMQQQQQQQHGGAESSSSLGASTAAHRTAAPVQYADAERVLDFGDCEDDNSSSSSSSSSCSANDVQPEQGGENEIAGGDRDAAALPLGDGDGIADDDDDGGHGGNDEQPKKTGGGDGDDDDDEEAETRRHARSARSVAAATTAENRPFSKKKRHPCLHAYGACRYRTSCILAACPRNLCLQWLRGDCLQKSECPLVHRIPEDDPALLALYHSSDHSPSE